MKHEQVIIMVKIEVDKGVADLVKLLNDIDGVYTHASCQGTIGEGGPNPYRTQVLTSWPNDLDWWMHQQFDITDQGECWGYVHEKKSVKQRQ